MCDDSNPYSKHMQFEKNFFSIWGWTDNRRSAKKIVCLKVTISTQYRSKAKRYALRFFYFCCFFFAYFLIWAAFHAIVEGKWGKMHWTLFVLVLSLLSFHFFCSSHRASLIHIRNQCKQIVVKSFNFKWISFGNKNKKS